ncbi:hypothetical protein F2Q68_00005281 [Brassica cretica]|uniref:Uncharacterized protein n=1 Tax=Brassica cretica TaxID=69181 RepID=A0A8S9JE11_BRACR|nr:hypothetical protein F2Q68_00005281 [Brassica cretica]
MSPSQNEKKNSDVEMGEASPVLPIPAIHEATPTFLARFLSFKERLSRHSAEKETSQTSAETSAIPSSTALSISAEGNKSLSDVAPLVGMDTAPVQVPEVLAQPSSSSTTPVPIPEIGQAMELMPPPLDRKEIFLGLPTPSAALLPKGRKRNGSVIETAKKRRCSKGAEGEPSFISLTDGMISDCGSEVSGLERDLGKSASALFRMKKEKIARDSEVRLLQCQIQSQEEPRTREPAVTVVPRDEFHARLTMMAVLFDSLMAVRKKDLALAGIEGGLSEIQLLKGEAIPTLDSEEARLLSHKEKLMASESDFDSILSLLKSECTLTPCLEETEGQGRAAEEGEGDAVERGDGEVAEGGDGDAVPSSDEVEDEGGATRSA